MKKIVNIIFILILLFMFYPKVNASSISWAEITEILEFSFEEEEGAKVTKTNDSFKVVIDNYEFDEDMLLKNYVFNLTYQNNIISMVTVDKSKLSEDEKYIYAYLDTNALYGIFDVIYEEYGIDVGEIDDSENSKYGIELEYEALGDDEDFVLDISKFSINLDTFESMVTSSVDTSAEEEPEVSDDITVDQVTNDENEDNPGTGDTTIYVIISFLVLCVGLIIYKFKSLDNYNSL